MVRSTASSLNEQLAVWVSGVTVQMDLAMHRVAAGGVRAPQPAGAVRARDHAPQAVRSEGAQILDRAVQANGLEMATGEHKDSLSGGGQHLDTRVEGEVILLGTVE